VKSVWSNSSYRIKKHSPIFVATLLQAILDRLRERGLLSGDIGRDYGLVVRVAYEYGRHDPEVLKHVDFTEAGSELKSTVISWYFFQTIGRNPRIAEPKDVLLVDEGLYRRFYEGLGRVLHEMV